MTAPRNAATLHLPTVMPMPVPRSTTLAAAGLLALSLATGCAGRAGAGHPSPSTPPRESAAIDDASSEIGKATDPDPATDPCNGYTLDGISLGMRRSEAKTIASLSPVPPSESLIEHVQGSIYAFRAKRPGRFDYVQLAFSPGEDDAKVEYIRGRVLVLPTDAWPASLFKMLGPPKRAKVSEWVWWDLSCGTTLRLSKLDALGGGEGHAYLVEIRHTTAADRATGSGSSVDMSAPDR